MPDECTSLGRLLQLPPIPEIPEHLRGRSFVLVEAAFLGALPAGEALLAPLRALCPEIDSFAMIPPSRLSEVNMDPDRPVGYRGDGTLLADFPGEAVEKVVEAFVGSPLLHFEARQLGGAVCTTSPENGALHCFDAPFLVFTFGIALNSEMAEAALRHAKAVLGGLAPWDSGRTYLNFTESVVDPAKLWSAASYERLCAIKAKVDPKGLFRANHSIAISRRQT